MPGELHALLPNATIHLITHFLVHPESAPHFRTLQRHTGVGIRSLQRELMYLDALDLVQGIETALVFGSSVRGDARPDSDMGLLVIGDDIANRALGEALLRVQALLGRPVDNEMLQRRKLADLAHRSRFLHDRARRPEGVARRIG